MSIRQRLALSFLAIMALFALNLALYYWGNDRRHAATEELKSAYINQTLLEQAGKGVNEVSQQVQILSQMVVEILKSGTSPKDQEAFNQRLERIGGGIALMDGHTSGESRESTRKFLDVYQRLAKSWSTFYSNYGRDQKVAIRELAMIADPLSSQLTEVLMKQLQKDIEARIARASRSLAEVEAWTTRITVAIFVASMILAAVVAFRLSRYLTVGLEELKIGALLIGSGSFNHRIPETGKDELTDLAKSYNQMAHDLYQTQKQMTHAQLELERQNQQVLRERQASEAMLLNILPEGIASELTGRGFVEPKYFEDVTILFTDFVGFTLSTEKLAAEELVAMLHDYFTAFDRIMERYRLEKMKTIGDSYMCVGGLPERTPSHPIDVVMAAFEMQEAVRERQGRDPRVSWQVRIGVHTGPVVAGIVGIRKFAFDIWGDDVNFASRMESAGAPGRINISSRTFSRVKDFIDCESRGRVQTKDKREALMYFANGIHPSLLDDLSGEVPAAFQRRYSIYFQKEPSAFPPHLLAAARQTAAEETPTPG